MIPALFFALLLPLTCVVGVLLWVGLGTLRGALNERDEVYDESFLFRCAVWAAALLTTGISCCAAVYKQDWWMIALAIVTGPAFGYKIWSLERMRKSRR